MRFARAATTALLALAAACSGGGDLASRFGVSTPTASPTAEGQPHRTVVMGKLKLPAPARMFAGTASQVGQLTRYCKSSTCEEPSARAPVYLPTPGSFVLFTLGEEPLSARAEVRVSPSDRPSVVKLDPSSLMVFNHGLVPGRYIVDLLVAWRTSEARWRFGLNIR